MVQLTQDCLYMDSPMYSIGIWHANLLVVLYNKLLSTFSFWLLFYKPHSNSSNTLDMLELHATLLTPDLARYSCVHACELHKRSDFTSFQPKKKVLYSRLYSSTRMTKFNIAESWWAWQWVNNATDPATATRLNLNWEANKTHFYNSRMATIMFDIICLATIDTKHLYHVYSGCIRFKLLHPRALRALGCHVLNQIHPS